MSDLISRQAAIEHLKKRLYETELNNDAKFPYYAEMADNRVGVWLEEVPTEEPKRGKWETEVRTMRGHKIPFFACSVCGRNADGEYPYCPNCGARMERSEE